MDKSTRTIVSAGIILLAAGAVYYAYSGQNIMTPAPSATSVALAKTLQVKRFAILPSPHITVLNVTKYNSNPPTSGPHLATPLPWGTYSKPVIDEAAVHNLEHGGIWISYAPGLDAASLKVLRQIAAKYPEAVILSPRPADPSPIAVVSWGRMMKLKTANSGKIESYIKAYVDQGPERLARL